MEIDSETPKVSIVIPVYNGANYLSEAIDSALAQTYSNIEILVIDDGSSDNGETARIALSYGDKVRYFWKENGGVASALNLGIQHMTGEFFSWLSHDDVYLPNKIEVQVDFLKKLNHKVVLYSNYNYVDEQLNFICTVRKHTEPREMRYALIDDYPVHGCTLLIPKKCLEVTGFFREDLKATQDFDYFFKLAGNYDFVHIPKVLLLSRLHPQQGMNTMKHILFDECNRNLCQQLDEIGEDWRKDLINDNAMRMLRLAISLKKRGHIGPADHAINLSNTLRGRGRFFWMRKLAFRSYYDVCDREYVQKLIHSIASINRTIFYLLYYCFARFLPASPQRLGWIGKALRYYLCRRLFSSIGKNVIIERNASFGWGLNIDIGDNSILGINSLISYASIGNNTVVGRDVMYIHEKIRFTSNGYRNPEIVREKRSLFVGDNVYIGSRVIIYPGLNIGSGAFIGDGAVVMDDVPERAIISGNPARVIRFL